jgi:K(+)-stimulated pyrophosphate-energized sodium pump
MNILIKLMSIVSLVIAPTLATLFHTRDTGVAKHHSVVEKRIAVRGNAPIPATMVPY